MQGSRGVTIALEADSERYIVNTSTSAPLWERRPRGTTKHTARPWLWTLTTVALLALDWTVMHAHPLLDSTKEACAVTL